MPIGEFPAILVPAVESVRRALKVVNKHSRGTTASVPAGPGPGRSGRVTTGKNLAGESANHTKIESMGGPGVSNQVRVRQDIRSKVTAGQLVALEVKGDRYTRGGYSWGRHASAWAAISLARDKVLRDGDGPRNNRAD